MNDLTSPQPASRRIHHLPGAEITVLAGSEQTGGQWAVVECRLSPLVPAAPAHWHAQTTEALYVLEGELIVSVDHTCQRATPGTFLHLPPGAVHRIGNDTDRPAHFLLFASPAGIEDYVAELAGLIQQAPVWPPDHPGVLERLTARYDRHPDLESDLPELSPPRSRL